jgi:hypothetical protein
MENESRKMPNWQHNSGKPKNGKGTCKGRLKARKEALRALKRKLKGVIPPCQDLSLELY